MGGIKPEGDSEFLARELQNTRIDAETGLLVWSGRSCDIAASFQAPPDKMRCIETFAVLDDDNNPVLDMDRSPLRRRCEGWQVLGGLKCIEHLGGRAKVISKAQERLVNAADAMTGMLIDMAMGVGLGATDAATQLRAINSVLDRAGIKAGVEINHTIAPWQEMLEKLAGSEVESVGE